MLEMLICRLAFYVFNVWCMCVYTLVDIYGMHVGMHVGIYVGMDVDMDVVVCMLDMQICRLAYYVFKHGMYYMVSMLEWTLWYAC